MEEVLPHGYAAVWADQHVLAELGGRTVREALDAGTSPKEVWAAVWADLQLPSTLR